MEKPGKIPKFEMKSDLLSRVSSFLPQLQAANEELQAATNEESLRRVDIDLEAEDAQSDSSSSDSDSTEEDEESSDKAEAQQAVIQLRFAVGKTDENPAISWLATGDNEEDKDEVNESDDNGQERLPQSQGTIQSLLGKRKSSPTKAKGPLIEELD